MIYQSASIILVDLLNAYRLPINCFFYSSDSDVKESFERVSCVLLPDASSSVFLVKRFLVKWLQVRRHTSEGQTVRYILAWYWPVRRQPSHYGRRSARSGGFSFHADYGHREHPNAKYHLKNVKIFSSTAHLNFRYIDR